MDKDLNIKIHTLYLIEKKVGNILKHIGTRRQRLVDLCEFQVSLVYRTLMGTLELHKESVTKQTKQVDLYCYSSYWAASSFSSFGLCYSSSIGDLVLTPMVG